MKCAILLFSCLCIALCSAAPADESSATVLKQDAQVLPESFQYAYETSNGISQNEEGHLINPGSENEAIAVKGSFTYVGADGVTYTVNYVADENGFQPSGAHLPVA